MLGVSSGSVIGVLVGWHCYPGPENSLVGLFGVLLSLPLSYVYYLRNQNEHKLRLSILWKS